MRPVGMKVGELAKRSGVSVRTLHYYDEIGLLSPSCHTEAGNRLYAAADVGRLQLIKSLQQLGFSLDEVRACLQCPDFSAHAVVQRHLARVREQIELQRQLCRRLEHLAARMDGAEEVSADEFLQTVEAMSMIEQYYSPEQLKELEERRRQVGEERIRQVEAEWPVLIAAVRAAMDQGTDPAAPSVQALAQRWRGLVQEFTGGNAGIEKSLKNMYEQESNVAGMDLAAMRPVMEYVSRALAAGQKPA